eukprot:9730682-Prorocentrum_lima.AAC.1
MAVRALLQSAPTTEVQVSMLMREQKSSKRTALHMAAWHGQEMALRALLEFATSLEVLEWMLVKEDVDGSTALHLAGNEM